MSENCHSGQESASTQIETGGGAAVSGNANVGGDFIGRDQRDHSDDVTGGKFHAQKILYINNPPVGSIVASTTPAPAPPPTPLPTVPNPYRGLQPFEAHHAANYFGRTAMVEKLLTKLQTPNFVAVVGPSGSGKSSLVRAGLLTALTEDKLPGSKDWAVAIVCPDDDPLRALATPLVNQIRSDLQPVEQQKQIRAMATSLQDGSLPIGDVLAGIRILHPGMPRLLIIFDQFEETFTLCRDEALRSVFLQTLLNAAKTPWLTILVTLRADFYGRVLADEPLGKQVDAGLVNVLPMTAEERRSAIQQPALNAGRRFEEGLVQTILDDIEAEPGELPLLQFALTELWKCQTPDGVLTHAAYGEIGGVSGAIARYADQTLKSLYGDEQAAVPRIFTRLVRVAQPEEGYEDTKRRITLTEVDATMQTLVLKLADKRLLVTGRDEQSGRETVEVAHEALIRNWDELKRWLNSDREFLLWRQRLRTLVTNWVASKADEGALLRGALLIEAERWLKTRAGDLSEQEQHFITTSRALAEQEAKEREAVRQRELAIERQRVKDERQWVVGLKVAFSIAIAIAALASYFYFDAQKQRGLAQANADLANQQLARLEGLRLYKEAEQFKLEGKVDEAIEDYIKANAADTTLNIDLVEQEKDVRRQAAILLVQAGEALARQSNLTGAIKKYQAALDLKPPPDTPVYVRVPAGKFTMGSTGMEWYSSADEMPQHQITLGEFWILRTEVTNGQYKECVEAKTTKGDPNGCEPPTNSNWDNPNEKYKPVVFVTWEQARQYTIWRGGRLPTEEEWEKACRGTDGRIYPWGNDWPTHELANSDYNESSAADVGSYPNGQSPYGLLDMAGNVWELTSSRYTDDSQDNRQSMRGGAFGKDVQNIRCATRKGQNPAEAEYWIGFRLVSPGF